MDDVFVGVDVSKDRLDGCVLVRLGGKELAALVGLAPFADDSGRHKGRRRVFGGRADVRAKLYRAALTVSHSHSPLGEWFRRLRARGKEFKVAVVARKLLTIVNAVVRSGEAYDATRLQPATIAGERLIMTFCP
jgi:transposase